MKTGTTRAPLTAAFHAGQALYLSILFAKIKQRNAELKAEKVAQRVQSSTVYPEIAGPCRMHRVSMRHNPCHQGTHRFVGDDKLHNYQEKNVYI